MAERIEQNHAELEAQNAELRESERMKTELVSIVSHELRTPLASVLGFTALLLKRESIRRSAGTTSGSSTRRHVGLPRCSKTFSTSSGSSTKASSWRRRESISLRFSTSRRSSMPSRARNTRSKSTSKSARYVRGDPDRLAQVVGNLLSNAIKYSPDGGTVQLTAERSGTGVRVIVRDEGLGIPEDQQERIFTKFFRGDAGATGITGTGLGLAVSREIVEAHGGSIGFDSDPSTGSTFWVELPEEPGEVNANNVKETPR